MTCPEEPLIAFLAGELSPDEERRFDEHLLGCEACWRAVQADRTARMALEQLREPAPAGLKSRVTLAVSLADGTGPAAPPAPGPPPSSRSPVPSVSARGPAKRYRPARWAAATALAAAVAVAGWLVVAGPSPTDPPQVAEVAAMVTPHSPPSTALAAGEHMVIAHQALLVRAYEISGGEAVVATSAKPFPVPASSHLLSGPSSKAWMATTGRLSMYGVNRPAGERSMFLVAAMPMAELPEVAAHLHLI